MSAEYVRAGPYGYCYPPDTVTKDELATIRARPKPEPRLTPAPASSAVDDDPVPCSICHGTGWLIPNRGESNGQSKLTAAQVAAIRRRFARGEKAHVLAELFGVNDENIRHIVKRRTWRHVP